MLRAQPSSTSSTVVLEQPDEPDATVDEPHPTYTHVQGEPDPRYPFMRESQVLGTQPTPVEPMTMEQNLAADGSPDNSNGERSFLGAIYYNTQQYLGHRC